MVQAAGCRVLAPAEGQMRRSARPFEPEFEQPTHEDIVRAKEAGLKLPAWAEEALAAEGG